MFAPKLTVIVVVSCLAFDNVRPEDICSQMCSCDEDTANCRARNISDLASDSTVPSHIKTLDFSLNSISFISKNFRNLWSFNSSVKEAIFRNNMIAGIADNLFQGADLELLDISFNQLEFIQSDGFQFLTNLQTLDLSSNRLSQIDSFWFEPLKNLIRLDLSNNDIGKCIVLSLQ